MINYEGNPFIPNEVTMTTTHVLPFQDTNLSEEARIDDLLSRLTVEEKILQMIYDADSVERLGIPEYNWWNECLHGVGRAGLATAFPQAIGMAATWNEVLIHRVAEAISDEARAKHHDFARQDKRGIYQGLTFWTPNINIFRDPRWGRGQETYGEDPYLTSRLGVAFVKGLQGDDPRYLKLVATPKHFAVHSGPEADRHRFDARASWRDMRLTYLPAFQATVQEGGAFSVMGAYNRTNGEACCASPTLLQKVLREEWGFEGYVVSDCGAIDDIYAHHRLVDTPEEAAALAVKNGCDLNCGKTYRSLVEAVEQGLITEAELDIALRRLFKARLRLGMFDPQEQVPYSSIPLEVVDCPEHRQLALETARQSMVLLKNEGVLPLRKDLKRVAVIGPNADQELVMLGNYYGTPAFITSVLEGIKKKVSPGTQVTYVRGCSILAEDRGGFAAAVALAKEADVAVVVLGLSQLVEGEEGQEEGNQPGEHSLGDRTRIALPGVQEDLLKEIHATGTPVVLVLLNGSAIAVNWAQAHIPAILEGWYGGQAGGDAVADVLFGETNPGGRLPVTFYQSEEQLPPFTDYGMEGKTYRYFRQPVLYPFGYGLSYTSFSYSQLQVRPTRARPHEQVMIDVTVKNTGNRDGDEVVQLYLQDMEASQPVPITSLMGFQRVHIPAGEEVRVRFTVGTNGLFIVDENDQSRLEAGKFCLWVGGCSPALYGSVAPIPELLSAEFDLTLDD